MCLSELDQNSSQQLQGGVTTTLFNNLNSSAERLQEIMAAQERFIHDFSIAKGTLPDSEIAALLKQVQTIQQNLTTSILPPVQSEMMPRYINLVETWIGGLSDPEVPTLGQDFLRMLKNANCRIVINPDLDCSAEYVSYTFNPKRPAFINQIGINPNRVSDEYDLFSTLNHELSHAGEKGASVALHYTPFNRTNTAMVHPLEWIHLENLCERDAYVKQGWLNSELSKTHPCVQEKSKFDLVPVAEFNAIRARCGSIAETLTECALQALDKFKWTNNKTYLLTDHYVDHALDNYERAMNARRQRGETAFTFLRLEDADLYEVGDYDVGPNPFGEHSLDACFKQRPRMLPAAQERLDALCKKYNIQPLESCVTLNEYTKKTEAVLTASVQTVDNPVRELALY